MKESCQRRLRRLQEELGFSDYFRYALAIARLEGYGNIFPFHLGALISAKAQNRELPVVWPRNWILLAKKSVST
jgi:hypothetical protein